VAKDVVKRFRASVHFVDNTYWDDGNRYTRRYHEFATLAGAVEFRRKTLKAKWYEATSYETGETDKFFLHDESHVHLDRLDGDGKWQRIKSPDVITLLGGVADD